MSGYQIKQIIKRLKEKVSKLWRSGLAAAGLGVLLVALILPLLMNHATALQINSRSLTLSTAVPSAASTSYTFGFKLGTAGQVQGMKFQACNAALGTCTAPSGLSFSSAAAPSKTGFTGATNFTVDGTGANDCVASASILCIKRTDVTSEDTTTAKTLLFATSITNPSGTGGTCTTVNCSFFIRMTTYTTNTWTAGSIVDTGTVAASTTATLTISAQVAEVLNFCIGTTSVTDATASPGADCSAISGTSVNLGTLASGTITTTPVATTTGGNNVNGIAMLRTNAANGTTVSYRAIQAGTGTNHLGALRVPGAVCASGASNIDQCFASQGTTQGTFTSNVEDFGMTVAGTNCGSTTAYTCALASGTNNLKASSNYIGASATTYGTTSGFAWDETGTFAQIAASTGASTSAVDDEALILAFAATPSTITPTGSYQVQTDFVVVSTY